MPRYKEKTKKKKSLLRRFREAILTVDGAKFKKYNKFLIQEYSDDKSHVYDIIREKDFGLIGTIVRKKGSNLYMASYGAFGKEKKFKNFKDARNWIIKTFNERMS